VTIDPLIESVEAAAYKIPTDAPEGDGTLAWDATTMVLARVRAGDTEGIGWTYGSAAAATVIANELTPVVEGRPALDVPGTTAAMIRAVRNVTRPGVAGYAISAVDIALWDLKAKLLGLPLFRLLGAVRNEVPVYGSGGFTPYSDDQLRTQLAGWAVEQRIPRVKIKIGESWGGGMARDLARMRQAREIVGDGVELYVDANGGYGRKQAIRVMAAAADLDIGWFEEPVSSDDLDGLREVDVRDGRGRLPAGRRVPLRGHHRVAAYGRRRRLLRAPAVRPLRAAPARARRGGDPELPSSGVVPRPRPDRIDVFRRHPRPGGRRNSACLGPARSGPGVPGRRRREVPHVLTTIKEKAWPNRLHLSC
jgi:L-alanine-DL-glutamate epimerase-like enolase superfamily enzyme